MPCTDHTATVPAGAGTTILAAGPTRLRRAVVTAAGTGSGAVLFYDSASAAAGTAIGAIPATVSAGTTFDFHMPAGLGVVCVAPASGPAITVSLD